MTDPLVEVKNVSKTYRLWTSPKGRLLSMFLERAQEMPLLPAAFKRRCTAAADRRGAPFHALSGVSFTLRRGESLGIIGRNGSGKSTLLQILAGTLQPSAGSYRVRGRTAALLELGSGFNPEFTGRENVLLQAALFGFSRREMLKRFGEVEEFAGIGEFIDQPVKVYSSGMLVRLAFATQTILEPELFIVDEALAVGDVFFQAKCAQFFEERLKAGMSLILVSHDLVAVKALCRTAIVMHQGRMSFHGASAEAVSHYHQLHRKPLAATTTPLMRAKSEAGTVVLPEGAVERNWNSPQEVGSREMEIVYFRQWRGEQEPGTSCDLGDEIRLEFYARSKVVLDRVVPCFEISNRHNQVIYGVTGIHLGLDPHRAEPGQLYRYSFTFRAATGSGEYLIDVALGWGDRGDGAPEQLLHRVAAISTLSVRHLGMRPGFFGAADLQARCEVA